jgi:hypothetical protein
MYSFRMVLVLDNRALLGAQPASLIASHVDSPEQGYRRFGFR